MPSLYLFPVPIGDSEPSKVLPAPNLALLREVKYFVVENLRSARRFLKAVDRNINIDELHFVELSEHTKPEEVESMLAPIAEGHSMGVLSEAGCPAVADPGADLVACAQRRDYRVVPLVGPSSILLSLMASGFNGQSFTFLGYIPVEAKARAAAFREMEREIRAHRRTQIFIETPYRNNRLIEEITKAFPNDFLLCVASDINGSRENIVTMPIARWKSTKYDYSKIPTIFLIFS